MARVLVDSVGFFNLEFRLFPPSFSFFFFLIAGVFRFFPFILDEEFFLCFRNLCFESLKDSLF